MMFGSTINSVFGPVLRGGESGPAITDNVLLIMAGQSNAAAAGSDGETPSYSSLSGVSILNVAGTAWEAYQPDVNSNPTGTDVTAWGPEAKFAEDFVAAYPDLNLYIVKVAEGGSSLEAGSGDDWAPSSTGELFEEMESDVAAAKALLDGASVTYQTVTLWNQGEADSKNALKFDAYYGTDGTDGAWADFIAAYRTRVDAGDFIAVRIRPYTGNASVTWAYGVRELDELWSDDNALFSIVDADFEDNGFANLHPGVAWLDGLGARAFARYNNAYGASYAELNDTTPDNLTFADAAGQTGEAVVTVAMSEALTGINRGSPITVSGGEYRIVNDLDDTVYTDWTTAAGLAHPYQRIELRATASATPGADVDVTVIVGGASDTWTVTTDDGTPANTAAPAITGTLRVGEGLNVSNGTWTNSPASYAYQWTRDGVDISGATSSAYTLVIADEATAIGCDVTATNATGSTTAAATGGGTVAAALSLPGGIAEVADGGWYDGQSSVLVAGSEGSITDLSGNGRTLVAPALSTAPTATTINGHTAFAFASNYLENAALVAGVPDAGFTVAWYGSLNSNDTKYLVSIGDVSDVNLFALGQRNQNVYRFAGSAGTNANLGASDTAVRSQIFVFDGTNLDHYTDGVDTGTGTTADLTGVTQTKVCVGGLPGDLTSIAMTLGELVIIPKAISAAEITALHSYFAARWAV
jgi:hypothetical protein